MGHAKDVRAARALDQGVQHTTGAAMLCLPLGTSTAWPVMNQVEALQTHANQHHALFILKPSLGDVKYCDPNHPIAHTSTHVAGRRGMMNRQAAGDGAATTHPLKNHGPRTTGHPAACSSLRAQATGPVRPPTALVSCHHQCLHSAGALPSQTCLLPRHSL